MGISKATSANKRDFQGGAFKGHILKVKHGYNPNSSSLGSIVFSLPVMLISTSTLFGLAASSLFAAIKHHHRCNDLKTPISESDSEKDQKRSEGPVV